MISFSEAKKDNAETLSQIQVKAFQDDINACGSGPPGYDSIESQKNCIDIYNYYLIFNHQAIVGGFYYRLEDRKCELIRIFIEPESQNKGIGSEVLNFLEAQPGIDLIELEASDFNIKNQKFYRNRGFSEIKKKYYSESSFSIIYRKRTNT
jgi:ribosomal protein S18 acetylase RimI-like enzyme